MLALVPSLPSCLDLGPVAVNPSFEDGQRFGEGPGECGQLIQRGGLNAAGVEVANDKSVAFGSSKRVGQHLMGYTVESPVEVLVTPSTVCKRAAFGLDSLVRLFVPLE
jgi:hypothetical protein